MKWAPVEKYKHSTHNYFVRRNVTESAINANALLHRWKRWEDFCSFLFFIENCYHFKWIVMERILGGTIQVEKQNHCRDCIFFPFFLKWAQEEFLFNTVWKMEDGCLFFTILYAVSVPLYGLCCIILYSASSWLSTSGDCVFGCMSSVRGLSNLHPLGVCMCILYLLFELRKIIASQVE